MYAFITTPTHARAHTHARTHTHTHTHTHVYVYMTQAWKEYDVYAADDEGGHWARTSDFAGSDEALVSLCERGRSRACACLCPSKCLCVFVSVCGIHRLSDRYRRTISNIC